MKTIYSNLFNTPVTSKKASIKGIVWHNDAGSMTPSQYNNWLTQRYQQGRLNLGFASIYINRHETLFFQPTDRVEWHTGNQYGNANYIGIEIGQSLSASDSDFLKNEEAGFKLAAQLLKSYNLPVNRNTVRLHNEFVATSCPHRSWELHCGKGTAYNTANKNKLKDYLIKNIKRYYDGGGSTKQATTDRWHTNRHGTQWRNAKGKFKVGNVPIMSRFDSPFLSARQGGYASPGSVFHYDELVRQNGHIWIGYRNKNGRRKYLPVKTWNSRTGSVGKDWGTWL